MKLKFSALENGKYSNLRAQIILKEAYDIQYGLYNHDDPNLSHPFQLHIWTEKKSVKQHGLYREYLRRYHIHQIHKYMGITFTEFLKLPIDYAEESFKIANELSEEDAKRLQAFQNDDMKDIEKGMGSMGELKFDGIGL